MTTQPQIKSIRGKSLKITTTEQEMIEFSKLCTEYTAYMLDIQTHEEMPSLETLNSAALPYKTFIANKLSVALNRVIEPNSIRCSTLGVVMIGGYFKVECSVWETEGKGKKAVTTIQSFKLTFMDSTGLPLATKLSQVLRGKYPDMTVEEFTEKTSHLF